MLDTQFSGGGDLWIIAHGVIYANAALEVAESIYTFGMELRLAVNDRAERAKLSVAAISGIQETAGAVLQLYAFSAVCWEPRSSADPNKVVAR